MSQDDITGGGTTPAGWYPSPTEPGMQRYWDGTQWTDHTAPLAGGYEAPAEQQQWAQAPAYGGPAYGAGYQPPPDPWLWQSIVATVLCCLPLGIPGIVYAAKSQSAAGTGDYVQAAAHAKTAKTWTLVSAGVALGLIVLYVMAVIIGFASFAGL